MKKVIIAFLLFGLTIPLFSSNLNQEVDKYWGARRQIVVIQKKEFTKSDKLELILFGGMVPNDAFYNSFPMGMRLDWFMSENLSFGLSGSYHINADTGSISVLKELGVKSKFMEKVNWDASLSASYSIIYGKGAMGKTTLAYFDLYLLGFASIYGTEFHPGSSYDKTDSSIRFGGGIGFGTRFYLTKNISFRMEARQNFFMRTPTSDGGQGGIQKPLELSLGIGWLF